MAEPYMRDLFKQGPLSKFDPALKKVVDFARFVAVYTFNLDTNKWEKVEFEGPLFVYLREGEPSSNMVVLNGLGVENFLEPLCRKMILQIHDPFLLFVNCKCTLYGIWFCDSEDCDRISHVMQGIIGGMGGSNEGMSTDPDRREENIRHMIEKVEEAYNNSKKNRADEGPLKKRQRLNEGSEADAEDSSDDDDDDKTPQSVMEFFARAGTAPINAQMGLMPGMMNMDGDDNERAAMNPLIHQIISNPHHSVQHIEKQQMATAQKKDVKGKEDNLEAGEGTSKGTEPAPEPKRSVKDFVAELEKCVEDQPPVGVTYDAVPGKGDSSPESLPCFPPLIPPLMPLPKEVFGHPKFGHIAIEDENPSPYVSPIPSPNPDANPNENPNENPNPGANPNENQNPVANPNENANANRPPAQNGGYNFDFVNAPSAFDEIFPVSKEDRKGAVSRKITPPRPESLNFNVEPLTVTQLLQALLYLLRTDPGFMDRIHEAYMKFLTDKNP